MPFTRCRHDSLPPNRVFPPPINSSQAFAAMDRLLDETRTGSFHLRQPPIADMVVEAIHYNAFVVMPNHVHLLATDKPIPKKHDRQTCQRNAIPNRQTLLAGRKL